MDYWHCSLFFCRVKENLMHIGQEQPATSHATTTAFSVSALDTAMSWSLINEHQNLQLKMLCSILCTEKKMTDWKNFNVGGYKLFKEGHVQKIYGCLCGHSVQIKAICLPEMKKDRT